jgi:WD40 repeat protein
MIWRLASWLLFALVAGVAATTAIAGDRFDRFDDPLPDGAITRMGTLRLRHPDIIHDLDFSPDGRTLASAGDEGVVRIWDVATGKQILKLPGHQGGAHAAAFSPDGKTLASGDHGTVRLWDLFTAREVRQFVGHDERVLYTQFSRDGEMLATRDFNGNVRLWEVRSGREIGRKASVFGPVLFMPDGKALLVRADDGRSIQVSDVRTGAAVWTHHGFRGSLYSAALSFDGKILAVVKTTGHSATDSSGPFVVTLYDAGDGRELHTFRGLDNPTSSVSFSPDGKTLFLGGNKTLTLRDAASGKLLRSLENCWGGSMTLSPDGKTVATVGTNTAIRLWDVASGREIHADRGHEGPICQITFSPDGAQLLTAGYDGTIRSWRVATGIENQRLSGIGYSPRMALSRDGRMLAAGSAFPPAVKWPVWLWDPTTGKGIQRIEGVGGAVQSLDFSANGERLATFNAHFYPQNISIRIYDVGSGKEAIIVDAPGRGTHSSADLAFTPGGEMLASTFGDNTIRFWVPMNGQEETRIGLAEGSAVHFAISPGGDKIAVASFNPDRLHVMERSGKELFRVEGMPNGVSFSSDGRLLAGGGHRSDVRVWDAMTGQEVARLPSHGWFSVAAFAPNGQLATAGSDTTALLWDLTALRPRPRPK